MKQSPRLVEQHTTCHKASQLAIVTQDRVSQTRFHLPLHHNPRASSRYIVSTPASLTFVRACVSAGPTWLLASRGLGHCSQLQCCCLHTSSLFLLPGLLPAWSLRRDRSELTSLLRQPKYAQDHMVPCPCNLTCGLEYSTSNCT
jgi:hypothetical protein